VDAGSLSLQRIAPIALAFGLLVSDTLQSEAQEVADPSGLRPVDFAVGEIRYRVLVPVGASVSFQDGKIWSIEVRYPRATRKVRLFRLGPETGESHTEYSQSMTLTNSAVLSYNIDASIGGGSGGVEAELKGRLSLGTNALAVLCHDQDEAGIPDPEWCVPHLHHLSAAGVW
jgi:hypothetical protein